MRLYTRIIMLVTVSVLGAGLVSSLFVSRSVRQAQEKETEDRAEAVASILSEHILHNVMNEESQEARSALVQAVRETRDVQYAFVVGFDGEVFAHSFPDTIPRYLLAKQNLTDRRQRIFRTRFDATHLLDISRSLVPGRAAALHVGFNEEHLHEELDHLRRLILLITLIAAIIGISLGAFLSRRTTTPLAMLCESMRAYGQGEDQDIMGELGGGGEIAQLAQAFKAMKSERKSAEDSQRQAAHFMQTVIDGFPEALMVINRDYSIALGNKSARVAAGGMDVDLTGLTCHQISHHSDVPCAGKCHHCPMDEVLQRGVPVVAEHMHLDAGGGEYIVEVVAAPIFNEEGKVCQIIESCRDITARRRAETERHNLEKQMLRVQKLESLGLLAGGIAHDFNNILMAISGNAELAMMEMSADAPGRQNLEAIERAATRAAALAGQMLAYSGQGQFVVEPIDINEFVTDMSNILRVSIACNVTLRLNLADQVNTFLGDVTQIRQVIMNLITNASDAIGEEEGVVSVVTGVQACDRSFLDSSTSALHRVDQQPLPVGKYVFLEVSDTGCGMAPAVQQKLFDPFFTTKDDGHGLGMAAVQGIMRGHRGVVVVESKPDHGTVFRILFPVEEAKSLAEIPGTTCKSNRSVALSAGGFGTGTFSGTALVVDDEETLRILGQRMFERLGFGVIVAADGMQAVEEFRHHATEISCVMLDLTMPKLSGEKAFRAIRLIDPDARIILCSGYSQAKALGRIGRDVHVGFLQKPYTAAALAEKIRAIGC